MNQNDMETLAKTIANILQPQIEEMIESKLISKMEMILSNHIKAHNGDIMDQTLRIQTMSIMVTKMADDFASNKRSIKSATPPADGAVAATTVKSKSKAVKPKTFPKFKHQWYTAEYIANEEFRKLFNDKHLQANIEQHNTELDLVKRFNDEAGTIWAIVNKNPKDPLYIQIHTMFNEAKAANALTVGVPVTANVVATEVPVTVAPKTVRPGVIKKK